MIEGYHIRTMNRRDIELAVDWAADEGWNPGLHDDDCFFAADPGGFLLGVFNGEPIATISCVRYGEHFGFIGFYIVHPDYRGRGFGWRLWQAAMQHLHGRVIGLDGVLAQQDNYRRSGFALAYRNIRYQGVAPDAGPDAPQIVDLLSVPMPQVLACDSACFPAPRPAFLQAWLGAPGHMALGWRAQHDSAALGGYGVLRPCRDGYKIGPLLADTPAIAEQLFHALAARVPRGSAVFLDVPEPHAPAVQLAERHRMTRVFETARMYTGPAPTVAHEKVYGVTSFELG